ncbi:tumor necrosis factor receptor superfamily member 13B [Plectropomus leopardus]|uniref:tumor necrosis factor receptor superfamily member 13B n=1 Tax=Plectropomus leopardus TaxID=160734 RepID=UPI001C4C0CEA|nr:tumor necrosis factor receptor superfamily member 13B [Plectropomus leopardus]
MGGNCHEDQFLDPLLKRCIRCNTVCKETHVHARCTSYCESAVCKAQPGHYYDGLLKKCVRCAEVCAGPPPECSHHCQKTFFSSISQAPPHFATTKKLLVEVTSQIPNSRETSKVTTLEDSTILLYSLLSLCMLLLFFSLSLALVALVRKTRAKTSIPEPREANHNQERVVTMGKVVDQPQQNSTDFVSNSYRPTDREPSYDSSPTETCVCVHCFPDLKGQSQSNDRPLTAPYSFSQQPILHKAQMQTGGPVWTEGNLYQSRLEVQEGPELG